MTDKFVLAPSSIRIFPVQSKSTLSYRSPPGGITMKMGLAIAESGHVLCKSVSPLLFGVGGLQGVNELLHVLLTDAPFTVMHRRGIRSAPLRPSYPVSYLRLPNGWDTSRSRVAHQRVSRVLDGDISAQCAFVYSIALRSGIQSTGSGICGGGNGVVAVLVGVVLSMA